MAQTKRMRLDPFSVVGETGLKQSNGYIYEEFISKLKGRRLRAMLKEMSENDDTIGGMQFFLSGLIKGIDWRVEAWDESEKAIQQKEFIESCVDDMSHTWMDLIDEICSMFIYGFAPVEIVYKRRGGKNDDPKKRSKHNDGLIGWRKIELRAQDTIDQWLFDEDGGIKGVFQENIGYSYKMRTEKIFIPIEKMLLFRTTKTKNNPEGRSVYKNAVVPYCYKKRLQEIEAIGIERDAAGFPIFEAPPDLFEPPEDPDDETQAAEYASKQAMLSTLADIAKNIRKDALMGAVIPGEFDCNGDKTGFRLRTLEVNSGGGSMDRTSKVIERYDRGIARSLLMSMLFLGSTNVGARSMHESMTKSFTSAIKYYISSIKETLNRFAIPRLISVNGMDMDVMPYFETSELGDPDLDAISNFVKTMTVAGYDLTDQQTERHMRSLVRFPIPDEEGREDNPTPDLGDNGEDDGDGIAGVA